MDGAEGLGRTGLIPATFASQDIRYRNPYVQPGELIVLPDQAGQFFSEALFLHNTDKPFEQWRMIVRLTALDEDNNIIYPQPEPRDLAKRVRITLQDTSKSQVITKGPALVELVISSEEGDAGSWEWEVPYTFVRSEGFIVGVDTLAFPRMVIPDPDNPQQNVTVDVAQVRVAISFEGFLTVIQTASDSR
jgi:hypothetical protein